MQSNPWELGPGTVHSLRNVTELDQLSPALRDLVPSHMRELFEDSASTLTALADRIDLPSYAQWLRAAANSKTTIEVYDLPPGAGMPSVALLSFDFGTYTNPHGTFPWRLAATCKVGAPPQCPASLAAVWDSLGGIYEQYGGSGYLLEPDGVTSLAEMGDEVEHLLAQDEDSVMSREEARAWTPYFAADGDYLCYRADGASRWLGSEWGTSDKPRDAASFIDALFGSWSEMRSFHSA